MTDGQQGYINEYISNGHNATEAYKAAYPKCNKGHSQNAAVLMANPKIRGEIDRRLAKLAEKVDYSIERAVMELNSRFELLDKKAKAGDVKAISAQTTILKEKNDILGHHKTRTFIPAKSEQVGGLFVTPEERPAYEAAGKAFKLAMDVEEDESEDYGNVVRFVPSTTVPMKQLAEANPAQEKELTPSEIEKRERKARYSHPDPRANDTGYDVVPGDEKGSMPGKRNPTYSISGFS